jgi:1,4-dihydroxy-2-naphthoate octaprenyltransferase
MSDDKVKPGPGVWFAATRPFSFTASVTPVLIGAAWAFQSGDRIVWSMLPLFAISAVLIHAGTNLINDYEDFRNGVDREYTFGSSGLLVRGELAPRQVRSFAFSLFAIAFVVGLFIVRERGWGLLVLGAAGIVGGYFYTVNPVGYKYRALGEVFVFLFMGVLLVAGAYWAMTGTVTAAVVWGSLPISLLVTAILFANNTRDMKHDQAVGVRTLAGRMGFGQAQRVYGALVVGSYAVTAGLMLAGLVSVWALVVSLSLPKALGCIRTMRAGSEARPETLAALVFGTAQLHLLFGLLFAASLLL